MFHSSPLVAGLPEDTVWFATCDVRDCEQYLGPFSSDDTTLLDVAGWDTKGMHLCAQCNHEKPMAIPDATVEGAYIALTDFRHFVVRVMPNIIKKDELLSDLAEAMQRLGHDELLMKSVQEWANLTISQK